VTRRATAALFAGLALVALGACGDDGGSSDDDAATTTAAQTDTTTGSTDASTDDVVIVIEDVAFTTPDVTVAVGGSVTFDNQDNQPHTATGQGSGAFNTDRIDAGDTATVTFDEAGTFPFICSFHPFMKGTVTVE
jgi:plastocyanin